MIIGGITGTLSWDAKVEFLIGAVTASFICFFSIGYGSRLLIPLFKKPMTWRILDFGIGCFMLVLAYQLFRTAWSSF